MHNLHRCSFVDCLRIKWDFVTHPARMGFDGLPRSNDHVGKRDPDAPSGPGRRRGRLFPPAAGCQCRAWSDNSSTSIWSSIAAQPSSRSLCTSIFSKERMPRTASDALDILRGVCHSISAAYLAKSVPSSYRSVRRPLQSLLHHRFLRSSG